MRISRTMRLRLMCGTGALALWGGAAAAAEPVEIEAVTVTAQKRAQDTLDVGLNVAVDIKENMPGVLPVVTIRGVGLVDPDRKLALAYTMNRMGTDLVGDPRDVALIAAAYEGMA